MNRRFAGSNLNGDENFRDGEARDPIVLLNRVDSDVAVSADVRVENSRQEPNLRRIERVGERDLQVEVEYPALVWASRGSCDWGLPVVVRRV